MHSFLRSTLMFLALVAVAFADNEKVSKDIDSGKDDDDVDVIVQFASAPSSQELAQLGLSKFWFRSINGGTFRLKGAAAKYLKNNPKVKYVSKDRKITRMLDYANPTVFADMAFSSGWTGAGVGVAVLDSGIADHPDFKTSACGPQTRIVYKANFVPGETSTNDGYGHGTHVAGIIGGNSKCAESSMTRKFQGIAPAVNLVSMRVLDNTGAGSDSSVIAAIDAVISLKNTYNIRVMNLSLGRQIFEGYQTDPLCQAVERAWQAGIVVVVSAGNNGRYSVTKGYGTISSPGNDPYVITVGAMNDKLSTSRADDVMTTYSSKGPTMKDGIVKPDIVAPGNGIISTMLSGSTLATQLPNGVVPRSYYKSAIGNSGYYFKLSGTSMAAPMVSGAAALLIQKSPGLTPNQVKARLMKTASKNLPFLSSVYDSSTGTTYSIASDAFTVGAGYLDTLSALASNDSTLAPSTVPLSPAVSFSATTRKVSLIGSNSLVWGDSLIWGDSLVWGNSLIWGDSLIWGNSLVWGDTTAKGNSLIWGDSLVWGNSLIWGDSVAATSILALGDN